MIEMENTKKNIQLSEKSDFNPFGVPEGYFDSLSQRIMCNLETEKKPVKKVFLSRYLRQSMEIAAGILVLIIVLVFPFKDQKHATTTNSQTQSIDEVYFLSYSMDDNNIYELLQEDTPETTFDKKQLENVILGTVSEYELIVLNN